MSRWLTATLLACLLGASACTTETPLGDCKGVFDEKEKNPALVYETNKMNVVWAFLFFETGGIPFFVVGWDLYCPTSKK